jgi:hypothetical protein
LVSKFGQLGAIPWLIFFIFVGWEGFE